VCEELQIDHPSDEGWGQGWDALRNEFSDAVHRLLNLSCGVWFLCHSKWKDSKTRDGDEVEKLVPTLTGMCEEILNGPVDGWFAYDYNTNGDRVMVVSGSVRVGAGHRMDQPNSPHFRSPDGNPLKTIRMGSSAAEAYKNLLDAFNNEYVPPKKQKSTKKSSKKKRKGKKSKTA